MSCRRVVVACFALAAMGVMALPARAQVPPPPTPSPAFERAFLSEMDEATRAEVEKRATGGNTISGVIETMLLNSNQMTKHGKAGGALTIIAVDLVRGRGGRPDRTQPVRARSLRPEDTASPVTKWRALRHPPRPVDCNQSQTDQPGPVTTDTGSPPSDAGTYWR